MNIAIVGCGYVAEFYGQTLSNYPQLRLTGAWDTSAENLKIFCARWPARAYGSLEQLLVDPSIEMILNLTGPRSHDDVTRQCLEAGKHVYSEKPLAMTAAAAEALVRLAEANGVYLASAPCSMLNQTAQTLWRGLREGAIGQVRLVYANFDDGMIAPREAPWQWKNDAGLAWPAKDEFEVGCTYEHAGYFLTWLAAFFGPALKVTAFASCLIPDKGIAVDTMAPDFTTGCIEYGGGVVARVTCGLVAPQDKSLTIVGDMGILTVANLRHDLSPVRWRAIPPGRWEGRVENRVNNFRKFWKMPGWEKRWHVWRNYPMRGQAPGPLTSAGKPVDFCRGPAELADAIAEKRACRLSAELGQHITELVERLQYPERFAGRPEVMSRFAPILPLPAHV